MIGCSNVCGPYWWLGPYLNAKGIKQAAAGAPGWLLPVHAVPIYVYTTSLCAGEGWFGPAAPDAKTPTYLTRVRVGKVTTGETGAVATRCGTVLGSRRPGAGSSVRRGAATNPLREQAAAWERCPGSAPPAGRSGEAGH